MYAIQYGQTTIAFRLEHRDRETLEIAVEPDATVSVAAPIGTSLDDVFARVKKRAAWIRRQQKYFSQFLPKTPDRQYVSGETHLYLGRQYRLKVRPHVQKGVTMERGFILVQSHRPECRIQTRDQVQQWFRDKATARFSERLEASLALFPSPETYRPNDLMIRSLRMRWGSMSPKRNLLLNWRLIQAPVDAIDYVITHELCHIDEPHHGPGFYELLEKVMPDWEQRKMTLERILA